MIAKILILFVFLLVLNSGFASADTLRVGEGEDYTTIQSAIDIADPGDIILVKEGIYYENLIIRKNSISIIGNNKKNTIIDGKKTGSGILIEKVSSIKISKLTVQNSGGSGKSDAGITFYSSHNNIITDTTLANNVVGISIYEDSNNNIISENDINSNGIYGILIFSSHNNNIFSNNIQNNKIGIYADSSRKNKIYSNNFIDNTNENAYDNSNSNSWDNGVSGNYWSSQKNTSVYIISGTPKAKDNYPLSIPVIIQYKANIPLIEDSVFVEKTKSSSGFLGLFALTMIFIIIIIKRKV